MTTLGTKTKLIAVGASCAALGASGGAILNASAHGGRHHAPLHRLQGARVVHADLVLAQRDGSFADAHVDRGFVTGVSGDQLTLREGTKKATYKTVTLTIPSDARVRDNGRRASLGDLQDGQHVMVFQGPKATFVVARDAR